MVIKFCIAIACYVFVLYIPGIAVLKAFRVPALPSIAFAPVVTCFYYFILAIIFFSLGIPSNWWIYVGSLLVIGILAWPLSRLITSRRTPKNLPSPKAKSIYGIFDVVVFIGFICIGIITTWLVFVNNLPTFYSFSEMSDNIHHLSQIETFIDSGAWTPFGSSFYAESQGFTRSAAPGSFYPSGSLLICAMVGDMTGSSVVFLVNAAMVAFVAIMYPINMFIFLKTLDPQNKKLLIGGLGTCFAFTCFPLGLFAGPPIFPNLCALCFIFLPLVLFIKLTSFDLTRKKRIKIGIFFFISLIVAALLHPNTLFTCGVVLFPFCIARTIQKIKRTNSILNKKRAILFAILGWIVLFVGVWLCTYLSPAIRHMSQVGMDRGQTATFIDGLYNVFFLSFDHRSSNILLGSLVIAGIINLLWKKKNRWLIVSYFLIAAIYLASICMDSTLLRRIIIGFWFGVPERIISALPIVGVAIAANGFILISDLIDKGLSAVRKWRKSIPQALSLSIIFVLSISFLISLHIPSEVMTDNEKAKTPYEHVIAQIQFHFMPHMATTYTEKEREFVKEAMEYITEDDLVVNMPFDGSIFAYGTAHVPTLYRYITDTYDNFEDPGSVTVRMRLDDYAWDEEVQQAVKDLGVTYYLKLGEPNTELAYFSQYYNPNQWKGILGINDDTPGFEKVLSEGDMRLYRLEEVDQLQN